MKRASGVLMHISSLFGDYSIGGFSENAKYFIDFLAECGFSYWQVLPFGTVDDYHSPYQSYSAFGGNPYFVDLETLHRKGLLTASELADSRQKTPYSCEFDRLRNQRDSLLLTASLRATNREEIEQFISDNPYLEQFCRFMAAKEANGGVSWHDWKHDTVCPRQLFKWKFIQFEFFSQWAKIKAYANEKHVKIIGDMPFYVAYDSADMWGNPDQFQLDSNGQPACVAGVPPDYFSQDGQLWGNPLYHWDNMEKNGYKWWCDRLQHMLTLFDGVRIDHFRAIESYWSVDAGAKTAREGRWMKGPGRKLIDAINGIRGDKLIIAEDLGEITDEVRALVEYSGFPGMRVLQFGFLGHDDSTHRPHHYVNHCVAYTGTHDNNTLLGYVWELEDKKRRQLLKYCGHGSADWGSGCESIIRTAFMSHAGLLVLPVQDLLGYGADTRMNTPGKAEGNWQFRVTKQQLDTIDRQHFSRLNRLYGRNG